MSTKAFLWCGLNMVVLLVFGAIVGAGHVRGVPGFLAGLAVGVAAYRIAKRMIRAGSMT